ncbi:MAG: hypothetical protein ACLR6B_02885 [Blautia sp.]
MRKYLVCGLDDENYSDATYRLCDTTDEAVEAAKANVTDCLGLDYDPEVTIGNDHGKLRVEYKEDTCFYVNVIIEIDVNDGDFIGILHHAYDGVDFFVKVAGSREECLAKLKEECKALADVSYQEYTDQIIADDGINWWVGDIYKFKK